MDFPIGEKASYNFFRTLRTIWQRGGVSRTELGTIHELDKTTVSQIVLQLLDWGIVKVLDIETTNSRRGRKSELLAVEDDWAMVAGIEIRDDAINAVVTNLHGEVIAAHYHRQPTDRSNLDDAVLSSLKSLQSDDRCSHRALVGVGVGVTGIVNRTDRIIA